MNIIRKVTAVFNGRSLRNKSRLQITGVTNIVVPNMASVLKILLPITFPNAISLLPFMADTVLTTNSGNEVPKATIVSPIIKVETLNLRATDEAPSVRKSAPFTTNISPRMNWIINVMVSIAFYYVLVLGSIIILSAVNKNNLKPPHLLNHVGDEEACC